MKLLIAMAFTKEQWENHIRSRLEGVLVEYSKQKCSELMELTSIPEFDWSNEITKLLKKIENLYNKPTKTNFNKVKAFKELVNDASLAYDKVLEGCKEFVYDLRSNPLSSLRERSEEARVKIKKENWESEDLILEMLARYSEFLNTKLG